jgi:hypothetical protein
LIVEIGIGMKKRKNGWWNWWERIDEMFIIKWHPKNEWIEMKSGWQIQWNFVNRKVGSGTLLLATDRSPYLLRQFMVLTEKGDMQKVEYTEDQKSNKFKKYLFYDNNNRCHSPSPSFSAPNDSKI